MLGVSAKKKNKKLKGIYWRRNSILNEIVRVGFLEKGDI